MSLRYDKPVGTDLIAFHMKVVKEWASGKNGMFAPIVMRINKMPYPPLFHLIFVPSFWMGIEYEFARLIQALLLPSALIGSVWVMRKHSGEEAGLYCGMFLLGSLAFTDRLLQAIPQSLDFVLFPIAVYAYLGKHRKTFVLTSLAMIYNHGFVALAFIGGLCLLALIEKRKTEVFSIGVFSTPVILPSLFFLVPTLLNWSTLGETPQEKAFIANPVAFMATYLGFLTVGFALAFYLIFFRRKQLSPLDKICLLTFASLLVMAPIWVDRWIGYVVIPLAFLLSNHITKLETRWKIILIPFVVMGFLFFYSFPWLWLINNTIHVL